jgi:lipid-A-disaccharide synthase
MNAPVLATDIAGSARADTLNVFLIAGEPSGDALGADLMRALVERAGRVRFCGVGGAAMEAQGLTSLMPLADVSIIGILPVLTRLPHLIDAIARIATAAIAANPGILVIIDSPDFTHRVARRVRRVRPNLPIVNYVSPSVWAWRSGRARRMCAYVDHVLALLPFEPAAYRRLGGPDCTYVGHPLVDAMAVLGSSAEAQRPQEPPRSVLLVMPGSRESEIRRLMPVFGSALALLNPNDFEVVVPTLPHLQSLVRSEAQKWATKPRIVTDAHDKYGVMRRARAALVASGTATLELALFGVPMVVAYRVSRVEELIAQLMLHITNIALPNLIVGRTIVPELLQNHCAAKSLAKALTPLLTGGSERDAQIVGLAEVKRRMRADRPRRSSDYAAELVESLARAPLRRR